MHIYEGVLSNSPEGIAVLSAGIVATAAGTALGLRKMDYERVPQVAMLSSAFFVVSLIPVPLGGTSVHLVLCGLMGLILGWAAFPAVLIALVLQAMFFGIGGPTTLGINTLSMALPAVVCHYLFRKALHSKSETVTFLAGLGAGALGVMLGALVVALAMLAAGSEFKLVAGAALLVHLIVAPAEGLITGVSVVFLRKVRPELLEAPFLAPAPYAEVADA
jgi:cobalt/nickel transport system permease protein